MLIRILLSLNRSINIIMDCCYSWNPIGWLVLYCRERQQCWCIKILSASFLFLLLPKMYVWVEWEWERVKDSWVCIHTGTDYTSMNHFLFVLPWSKSFLVFLDTNTNPHGHTSRYMLHMNMPPSSMPITQCTRSHFLLACHPHNLCIVSAGEHLHPVYFGNQVYFLLSVQLPSSMPFMQLIWHFCWSICILFPLGNRCISCYATYTICAACQRDCQVNKQY